MCATLVHGKKSVLPEIWLCLTFAYALASSNSGLLRVVLRLKLGMTRRALAQDNLSPVYSKGDWCVCFRTIGQGELIETGNEDDLRPDDFLGNTSHDSVTGRLDEGARLW